MRIVRATQNTADLKDHGVIRQVKKSRLRQPAKREIRVYVFSKKLVHG